MSDPTTDPTAPVCPQCHGRKMTRQPDAWVPCVCWWRDLILSKIPPILTQGEDKLGPEVIATEPWPLTEDRFEIGEGRDWTWYRRQVWWSLAHAIYDAYKSSASPKLPRVLVFDTPRLRDIHFGEDPDFKTLRALLDLDLLVIVGGTEPAMSRSHLEDLTESLIRLRYMHGGAVWGYRLASHLTRLSRNATVIPGAGPTTVARAMSPSPTAAITIGPDGKPRIW